MSLTSFPRGQISINGGKSRQATDFDAKHANGVKMKPTLRRSAGGFVDGAEQMTGTMNIAVDADGDEFDFIGACRYKIPVQITTKEPGNVRNVYTVKFTEVGTSFKVEDGTMRSVSFIGWFAD